MNQAGQQGLSSEDWKRMGFISMKSARYEAYQEVMDAAEGLRLVFPTGFSRLDRQLMGGFTPGKLYVISGRPGCFAKGTMVRMYDGSLKAVEDVEIGDQLMGPDSKPRNVNRLCRGREKMYRVDQKYGDPYIVNENHILSLVRSRKEGGHSQKEIVNISVKDYLKKSSKWKSNYKGYKARIDYDAENIDTSINIDPYFLGIWLGDGTKIRQDVTTGDLEISDYLSEYTRFLDDHHNENYTISATYKPNSVAATYKIMTTRGEKNWLLDELRSKGLTIYKHIPSNYKIASRDDRLSLLAGLIDSDGYVDPSRHYCEITQVNKILAMDILELVRGLGFRANSTIKKVSCNNCTESFDADGYVAYRITISGDLRSIPTKIKRKQVTEPRKMNKRPLVSGIRVSPLEEDDYYGFTLDGDHLFLLEDGTVTHNSGKSFFSNEILFRVLNLAKEEGKKVICLYFTFEMPAKQQLMRLMTKDLRIGMADLLSVDKSLDKSLISKAAEVTDRYATLPVYFKQVSSTINEAFNYVKKVHESYPDHTIINLWDHSRLFMANDPSEAELTRLVSLTQGMVRMQQKTNCINILLSQLNRNIEMPQRRATQFQPMLSDLFGSDSIGQEAEVVMMINRPYDLYQITSKYCNHDPVGLMALHIEKNRNGELGMIPFDVDMSKFTISERNN